MHSVLEQRKQLQKQYISVGKTDLFYNSMGLCGNFTVILGVKVSFKEEYIIFIFLQVQPQRASVNMRICSLGAVGQSSFRILAISYDGCSFTRRESVNHALDKSCPDTDIDPTFVFLS